MSTTIQSILNLMIYKLRGR